MLSCLAVSEAFRTPFVNLHRVNIGIICFSVVWLNNTLGFGDRSILSNNFLQLLDLIEVVENRAPEYCLEEVI